MFRKSLKADFYRLKKDNLLWISVIVVVGFALFTFGVYLLIDHLVADDEFMPISITTLTAFKSALNLTDNAGFIILIMTVVLLAKDFRQNTIRNKIIVGVKRSGAYFSSLIVTYLYVLAIMTFNAILTALLFTTAFESGVTEGNVFLEFLKNYAMGVVILTPWVIIIHFLTYITKSLGLALGITLGVYFILQLIAIIPQIVGVSDTTNIIMHINPSIQTMSYTLGSIFEEKKAFWVSIGSDVAISGLLIFLGSYLFNKADLK